MGLWGRRDREAQEQQDAADEALSLRARSALVAADERIRTTSDELGFATAELGDEATAALRVALESVRTHLIEAFHLHQLNHDEIPDTPEELRTRNARIVQLCDWAEQVLEERLTELRGRVEQVRRAPQAVAQLRSTAEQLRGRLPDADETVRRLSELYSDAALARVRSNVADAARFIELTLRGADLAEKRRAAHEHTEANLALETATETSRRAAALIDAVDSFEIEALRAQSTLADVIEDSRGDLAAARAERRTPEVEATMARLSDALDAVRGSNRDPFADLAALSEANAALDTARERAARPVIPLPQVQHAIEAADHSIAFAARVIDGNRGWIGADARTRLAEAQRVRAELAALSTAEDLREEALRLARRASELADDALRSAQRDIDDARPAAGGGWGEFSSNTSRAEYSMRHGSGSHGGSAGGSGGGIGSMLGPVIGGVILGGLLDDIFD